MDRRDLVEYTAAYAAQQHTACDDLDAQGSNNIVYCGNCSQVLLDYASKL